MSNYDPEHYLQNRKRIREYQREHYSKNKESARSAQREKRAKDPEGFRAKRRASYAENREAINKYARDYKLKKRYGLSRQQLGDLDSRQGHQCAGCGGPPGVKGWHVDHCHTSGKVRGLLCFRCNAALGLVSDSVETLQSLIGYLQTHQREVANA